MYRCGRGGLVHRSGGWSLARRDTPASPPGLWLGNRRERRTGRSGASVPVSNSGFRFDQRNEPILQNSPYRRRQGRRHRLVLGGEPKCRTRKRRLHRSVLAGPCQRPGQCCSRGVRFVPYPCAQERRNGLGLGGELLRPARGRHRLWQKRSSPGRGAHGRDRRGGRLRDELRAQERRHGMGLGPELQWPDRRRHDDGPLEPRAGSGPVRSHRHRRGQRPRRGAYRRRPGLGLGKQLLRPARRRYGHRPVEPRAGRRINRGVHGGVRGVSQPCPEDRRDGLGLGKQRLRSARPGFLRLPGSRSHDGSKPVQRRVAGRGLRPQRRPPQRRDLSGIRLQPGWPVGRRDHGRQILAGAHHPSERCPRGFRRGRLQYCAEKRRHCVVFGARHPRRDRFGAYALPSLSHANSRHSRRRGDGRGVLLKRLPEERRYRLDHGLQLERAAWKRDLG